MFLNNSPELWKKQLPLKTGAHHKYDYGLAFIYAAPLLTGATRLAASACARMGCGLTSVIASPKTADIYKITLPAHIMVQNDLSYSHDKMSARLIGCGGIAQDLDIGQLKAPKDIITILDADALRPDIIKMPFATSTILTPHEGEFTRLFPNIKGTPVDKATKAAKAVNAIIVLKGAETIIASPDGQIVVNSHASPFLATAGSGDVLAGMITGLCAQHMAPFEAACAATWIHGECAMRFGAGLVASDIELIIPQVLQDLHKKQF